MTLVRLAWRLLAVRPAAALLSLLMLSLGWAALCFVLLMGAQLETRAQRDLAGIDLVVGAKGSPLQSVLAGLFHVDTPTGNLPLGAVAALRDQPLVAQVWPISLGDSLRGWRIVGAEPDYLALYGGTLAQGRVWQAPMQAVLGAEVARRTGLQLGQRFVGSHGLGSTGEVHDSHPYEVVGILAPNGSVLDRLVLTDLASVWQVHEDLHALDETDRTALRAEREVTLLLVRYRSPLAAALLPHWVNAQEGWQAASPALESARLLRMLGAGRELLQGFGALLLLSSVLSLFLTQWQLVHERRADLALLRLMGAPPWRLALLVALQALGVVLAALVLGMTLALAAQWGLAHWLAQQQALPLQPWFWSPVLAWLLPTGLGVALLAAAAPAWRALRTDVGLLLQSPR